MGSTKRSITSWLNGSMSICRITFRSRIIGGVPTAKLNGKDVQPRNVSVTKGNIAECSCNGEPLEIMRNIPNSGGIGLQAEDGKFEFRNVRVKELD